MKELLCIAALAAVAIARPELYKEDEEFQYTRSSSDDGTKAGFYGARRGNMGGNYEKAHNMDHLAQNQMSGLVSQVNGELGDSAKLRAGDVFAGGNSRGIYGSSSYDLSNLQGRNFQEGERVGFGDTHSALASQNLAGHHSSGYNSQSANSQYNGYQSTKSAQALHSANLQATSGAVGAYGYGRQSGYSSGHSSQYGYQNADVVPSNRLISTAPVRVVVRPGSTVAVPVGVQNYDTVHASHSSIIDHNTINTEAEVLTVPDHVIYKPSSNSKYYESSSNYQKHWEKHDTKPDVIPLAIPTENPFPKNSELYDDAQAQHTSSLDYGGLGNSYNSAYNTKSASSQYQSAHNQFASGINSNTHGAYVGGIADSTNGLGSGANAKSHSSSYAYHKSWERQGDPYVISPVVGVDTASQRLTAGTQGYGLHQYGAHTKSAHQRYYQANGEECDCDENGHLRVSRAVDNKDFGQQTQDQWEDLTQHTQSGSDQQIPHASEKLEDLGQQTQKQWGDLTQQAQRGWDREGIRTSENFKELGQQTQKQWDDVRKQTAGNWAHQADKNREMYRQMGLQTQKQWEDLSRQTQKNWHQEAQRNAENFEILGQQTQKQWGDLTQQSQSGWNRHHQRASEKLEDFGQQSQDKSEDLTKQAQNSWDGGRHKADQKLENFGQQAQTDFGQQTQVNWNAEDKRLVNNPNSFMDTVQKPENPWYKEDFGQKVDTPDTAIIQRQHLNDDEQQIEMSSGFETLHSYGLKKNDISDEDNFDFQHYTNRKQKGEDVNRPFDNVNWRLYQPHYDDQNEEHTGQTQQSWDDFFHNSNINKDASLDAPRPKLMWQHWEQTEDNTEQENYDSFFAKDNQSQWKPISQDSAKKYSRRQDIFGSRVNNDYTGNRQDEDSTQQSQGSLKGLWDKIKNFDKVSTFASDQEQKTNNSSISWQRQSTLQNSYLTTLGDNQTHEHNFTTEQNLYQNNLNGRSPRYNPWISMIGDSGMFNHQPTSTTVKSTDETPITNPMSPINEDIGRGDIEKQISSPVISSDIGRGDIGSEDAYRTTTTNKPFVSSGIQGSLTFTEDRKRDKTAEEIEALSLIRNFDSECNETKRLDTAFIQSQDSSELKVIGIEENKHRTMNNSGIRRNRGSFNYIEEFRNIAKSQPKNIANSQPRNTANSQITNTQEVQTETGSKLLFYNKQIDKSGQDSTQALNRQNTENKPSFVTRQKLYTNSNKNADLTEQNLQNEYQYDEDEKKLFEQKNEEDHNLDQTEPQDGSFEQNSDHSNFERQSHETWRQNLNDFGQEEQTAWTPEELETRQNEQLSKSNTDAYQSQDFYNQQYKQHTASERLQADSLIRSESPEHFNTVANSQTPLQVTSEISLAPMEPAEATVKPGFWKSVGSKLTSAKDKVASWFKQS